jgi:predicted RNA-binding protein with PUA domain
VIDQRVSPWCDSCNLPHDQETCVISNDFTQLVNEECPSDLNNFVGEVPDMINNVSNPSNEQVKGIKGLEKYTIARAWPLSHLKMK